MEGRSSDGRVSVHSFLFQGKKFCARTRQSELRRLPRALSLSENRTPHRTNSSGLGAVIFLRRDSSFVTHCHRRHVSSLAGIIRERRAQEDPPSCRQFASVSTRRRKRGGTRIHSTALPDSSVILSSPPMRVSLPCGLALSLLPYSGRLTPRMTPALRFVTAQGNLHAALSKVLRCC